MIFFEKLYKLKVGNPLPNDLSYVPEKLHKNIG